MRYYPERKNRRVGPRHKPPQRPRVRYAGSLRLSSGGRAILRSIPRRIATVADSSTQEAQPTKIGSPKGRMVHHPWKEGNSCHRAHGARQNSVMRADPRPRALRSPASHSISRPTASDSQDQNTLDSPKGLATEYTRASAVPSAGCRLALTARWLPGEDTSAVHRGIDAGVWTRTGNIVATRVGG